MSWYEYNDMFENAQICGKYRVFIFDVKSSRVNGYDSKKILMLISSICDRIKLVEKELNKKILYMPKKNFLHYARILGDMFSLTVYNNSISSDEIYNMFKEEKENLKIESEFHFDDGAYETDNWALGKELYLSDYCIQFLDDRSKMKKEII